MSALFRTRYMIELLCDYPEWWRYNVYIMAVGFEEEGGNGIFNNFIDKVYDVSHGGDPRTQPEGYKSPRVIKFQTEECAFIDLYIYIVTNTFPATAIIGDWLPFTVTLRVSADGIPVEQKDYEVNQWGGLTVVAHRIDAHQT